MIFQRLEREIHGFLVGMGKAKQRTNEFVDRGGMVERFVETWGKVADTIEKRVVKRIEAGKESVMI